MNNLRAIRRSKNISQQELAEKLGTTQGAVSQWEKGVSNPRFDKLAKLCEILNCSIDDLTKKGA